MMHYVIIISVVTTKWTDHVARLLLIVSGMKGYIYSYKYIVAF